MNALIVIVASLWLFTAAVHAILGGRAILGPVLESGLSTTVRATSEVGWHLITWQFVVMGGVGAVAAVTGSHLEWFAHASFAFAVGSALLFVGFGVRRFGDLWHLPQWVLFTPIAALSLAAPLDFHLSFAAVSVAAALLASAVLATLALLHVAWALGSPFPARSRSELARLVVGEELRSTTMPGRVATYAVAACLFVAAMVVAAIGLLPPAHAASTALRGPAVLVAVAFALRGVGGFFEVLVRPAILGTPYLAWSRLLYSPLCLLLAVLIGVTVAG